MPWRQYIPALPHQTQALCGFEIVHHLFRTRHVLRETELLVIVLQMPSTAFPISQPFSNTGIERSAINEALACPPLCMWRYYG